MVKTKEKKMKRYDVAIVGAGGAGQMATLRAVLNHLEVITFLGNPNISRASRSDWVEKVETVPGFFDKKNPIAETSNEVFAFIESKKEHKKFLTKVERAVAFIDKKEDGFEVFDGSQTYWARAVVLCTGTTDVQPMIQGSIKPILPFAKGGDVYYSLHSDGHRSVGQEVAIIGHGSVASSVAMTLKERYDCPKITILTNGKFWNDSKETNAWLEKYEIRIEESEIHEIIGTPGEEGLQGFRLADTEVTATKVFVCLGEIVYNELAKQVGADLDANEYVVTDDRGETSVANFYAVGDLVSGKKKQVYTAWDMAVDVIDKIDEKTREIKRQSLGTEQMVMST